MPKETKIFDPADGFAPFLGCLERERPTDGT